MKWLPRILAAGASLLAMTAHASADPISIGFFLFAGPLGSVFSFSTLVTAASVALAVGPTVASLAISALQRRPTINPGEAKNTFQESESSEINAIGRARLGGLKAFGNTDGNNIYRLIWHSAGPAVAIEEYHVGGREVVVDSDGKVSSPPWARIQAGVPTSWMFIQSKIGDGAETAWTDLMTAFPTLWTSAHRCRGIFQSLVRFQTPSLTSEKFAQLYQGGPPDITVTGRVNVAYDPRDPSHDVNDEDTWEWTDNGVLCAARILLSYPDLTVADVDWDFIADEADRADASVATKTATEPRARCWGVWPSESKRGETMQQVLDSIGAEIVMSDAGLIRIRLIDDDPTAEITFTARHQTEFNWKSGPEAVERPNVCRVKYYSPERNYDMAEIDLTGIAWARIEDEIERYGEKVEDIELPFCPSASQAQRIARRIFALKRADVGTIKTNMAGLAAWGLTYAAIEDSDAEETPVCKIASPRTDDEAGEVEIPFQVWPTLTAWNPATDEADAPDQVPDLQYESDLVTPNPMSGAIAVQYPGGSWEMRVAVSGATDGSGMEANFRTYTAGLPDPWQSMDEVGRTLAYKAGDYRGQNLDFRARVFNGDGDVSYFSDVYNKPSLAVDNSAPAAPTISNVQPIIDQFGTTTAYSADVSGSSITAVKIIADSTEGGGFTADHRPGTVHTITTLTATLPVTFSATAYSSSGAASATTQLVYNG
ncbi:MAG TPA: phage tail protein [Rhizobiaceae bacterium]|nr:phage tail protein [Rhizobiaceae bacterium]